LYRAYRLPLSRRNRTIRRGGRRNPYYGFVSAPQQNKKWAKILYPITVFAAFLSLQENDLKGNRLHDREWQMYSEQCSCGWRSRDQP